MEMANRLMRRTMTHPPRAAHVGRDRTIPNRFGHD
jgi:hypothetical protein